uniref:Uncharacterized protein n=1 Tax=Tetranychus urticae TaxID=32264 RepID=T1L113_TETUR
MLLFMLLFEKNKWKGKREDETRNIERDRKVRKKDEDEIDTHVDMKLR